jgi:ferric-dicitrate binding protein FerR (iron transport regulator)
MDHHQTLESYSSGTFYNMRRRLWRGQWMWPAAIILFLLSFALWQWFGMRMVQVRSSGTTSKGVQLPDQSVIMLNTRSTLRYHKHFASSAEREVWLSGDAVFSVPGHETGTGQAGRPFTVHTTAMDITVNGGARFRVTMSGPATRVGLTSGSAASIQFRNKKLHNKILHPGETLEYAGRGEPVIQQTGQ